MSMFLFPETIFTTNDMQSQLAHIKSEIAEVEQAIANNEGAERIIEEMFDAIGSLETGIIGLAQRTYVNADVIASGVIIKNAARGYYQSQPRHKLKEK